MKNKNYTLIGCVIGIILMSCGHPFIGGAIIGISLSIFN
jgi:hypothetical protein